MPTMYPAPEEITWKLFQATNAIKINDNTVFIEHASMPTSNPDINCTGDEAVNIRKVTYMGEADKVIATCKGCGLMVTLPKQSLTELGQILQQLVDRDRAK